MVRPQVYDAALKMIIRDCNNIRKYAPKCWVVVMRKETLSFLLKKCFVSRNKCAMSVGWGEALREEDMRWGKILGVYILTISREKGAKSGSESN